MNSFRYDYAVIGGDMRQVYLTQLLAEENKTVCCSALCTTDTSGYAASVPLETALGSSAHIIGPIPLSKDGGFFHQSGLKKNIPLKQLFTLLKPGQRFSAGCIPEDIRREALEKGVCVSDFMQDAALAHFNTIATAEGVICEAIKSSPVNLHKSCCAVLGYGKCGRILADDLKRMFCYVTVAASFEEELAQAAVYADETLRLESFLLRINKYDFIFNTIPNITLTRKALSRVKPSAVILDIASAPGGIELTAAKELSVNARSCPGLPGKYAPLSSARAIKETIIQNERSSPCL